MIKGVSAPSKNAIDVIQKYAFSHLNAALNGRGGGGGGGGGRW